MVTSSSKRKRALSEPDMGAIFNDADLVDRIFDYLVELHPEIRSRQVEIKQAVRAEFAGERVYVNRRGVRDQLALEVLRLFNGRNASEVARALKLSRATVYRMLKQPGRNSAAVPVVPALAARALPKSSLADDHPRERDTAPGELR